MSNTDYYCHGCAHWEWDSLYNTQGHCAIQSCACAQAILDHNPEPPPRYLSMEAIYEETPDIQAQEATEERADQS